VSDAAVLLTFGIVMLAGVGLAVGSFLNVVIYRVPLGLSIVRPGSACPTCHTPIGARDNVPVFSWLVLRGRCRTCRERISPRYPLVEILNAAVWLGLGWWAWHSDGLVWLLPLLLVLGSAGIALFFIDIEHHRLPDAIVLPLYPVTAAGLALAGIMSGAWPLTTTLVGVALWLIVIGGLWLVTGGRGMGFGDVKLAPILGATLGWVGVSSAAVGLLVAFATGAIVGVCLMAARRAGRRSALPFGPFLIIGSAVGLVVGEAAGTAYLDLTGL
jgi:leader peptidase (prepilin peptidase)/N-methyltransferase